MKHQALFSLNDKSKNFFHGCYIVKNTSEYLSKIQTQKLIAAETAQQNNTKKLRIGTNFPTKSAEPVNYQTCKIG